MINLANAEAIMTFAHMVRRGQSVALDMNLPTGELIAQFTASKDGERTGNGIPPVPYSAYWRRLALFINGKPQSDF